MTPEEIIKKHYSELGKKGWKAKLKKHGKKALFKALKEAASKGGKARWAK